MSSTPRTAAGQAPFYLTTMCERVQGELLDLADALQTAALAEYPDLARSFQACAAEFRRRLREHVGDVEHPQGLFPAIVRSDPRLERHIASLSEEHAAMERSVEGLAALLDRFDPAAASADAVRAAAASLAALVRRHQETARAMALSCCDAQGGCCHLRSQDPHGPPRAGPKPEVRA